MISKSEVAGFEVYRTDEIVSRSCTSPNMGYRLESVHVMCPLK